METKPTYGVFVNGAAWKVWDGPDALTKAAEQLEQIKANIAPRYIQGLDSSGRSAVMRVPNRLKIEINPSTYTSGGVVGSWEEQLT